MDIIKSLEWRYATKKFDESKHLTIDQINLLKKAFNLTATSYGLQPLKLVVIQNKKLQQSLVKHSHNQRQVAQASHVLVICIQNNLSESDIEEYFSLVKSIRNTPESLLNPFKNYLKTDFYSKSNAEIEQWMKNQAYIALGNLLTVAAIKKIDACPMEGFVPEEYNKLLELGKRNLKATLVVPVGFRAEDCFMKDLKKVRKNIQDVVIDIDENS